MSSPTYNALDLRADRIRARRMLWAGRLNRRWPARPSRTVGNP
jgi:hypothetical protein